MKTWAAVLAMVGVVSLGCGCAESAAEDEGREEVTGTASEAICHKQCSPQCGFYHGVRSCKTVCRTVCY